MMVTVSDIAPWLAIGFQVALFLSIQSWEIKIALIVVIAFQMWNKSKKQRTAQQ